MRTGTAARSPACTVKPLLFVGNYWDPATRYENAVKAARLSPNSRLLTSDSWGHLAYRSSECVTSAVGAYLVRLKLPAEGTVCVGDAQPFTDAEEEEEADQLRVHQLVGRPNRALALGLRRAGGPTTRLLCHDFDPGAAAAR